MFIVLQDLIADAFLKEITPHTVTIATNDNNTVPLLHSHIITIAYLSKNN